MSASALPEWLSPMWRRIVSDTARLPHAILFAAPRGSGKRQIAEALALRLLCGTPGADGFACGRCASCGWFLAGNHPDVHRLVPAAAEQADTEEDGERDKKASAQIVIEQVRDMQGLLEVGSHQGGRRIILIDPAEAMNVPTANALLKSLEEPPPDAVFLLVSHAPRRLLPTIRSRCQVWTLPRPDREAAAIWLAAQGVREAESLLGFTSGLPLAAMNFASGAQKDARQRFVADMLKCLKKGEPLKLAGEWDAWLKSRAALDAGLDMATLVSWLQRWLHDGASLAFGVRPRFFSDCTRELAAQSSGRGEAWIACYNELASYRRVAQHPLNARLFLEDILLRATRAMNRS